MGPPSASSELLAVELLRTQADIYEYLAAQGEDSKGIELAQRYSQLQAAINQELSSQTATPEEYTFDALVGEQLLEAISSRT